MSVADSSTGSSPSRPGASIDVVVVNWNSGSLLHSCLASIERHADGLVRRTVVVDNASTDGSLASIDSIGGVDVVRNDVNRGFGAACNQGAARGDGDYVLFLNPDAELLRGTLAGSAAYMQASRDARVGICSVQLVDEAGEIDRSCSRFPTATGIVAKSLGLTSRFPRLGASMREWPHDRTRVVDQVIGAYFLIRRELFEALGGFDERFFVYFEEVDLSLRARELGWSSVYLAEAQGFHVGGGTSRNVKGRRLFYSLRSRLLYAQKHFGPVRLAIATLATLVLEPISRTIHSAIRGPSAVRETLGGIASLYRWLPRWRSEGRSP